MTKNISRLTKKAISKEGLERIMSHLKKCRRFGVRYALISVIYEVVWKYNPYSKFARQLCRWKSSYIDSYLKNNYADIIEKYKSAECFQYKPADFAIWFFWWQGWNAAPQLIKNNFMTIKLLNEGGQSDICFKR